MLIALLPIALASPMDWATEHVGATLSVGPAATFATRTRQLGEPLTGFGPRAAAGVGLGLGGSWSVGVELAAHEVYAGEIVPSEAGAVEPYRRELHLYQQGLRATWRPGALAVSGGLSYARAVGRLRLGDLMDCEGDACASVGDADPADQPVSVSLRAGGPTMGLAWAAIDREGFRLSPALEAGAWTDRDRWYPWAALTVQAGFGR